MDHLAKAIDTSKKSTLKSVNLPNVRVICWKLTKTQLRKVAKFYGRLYGGVDGFSLTGLWQKLKKPWWRVCCPHQWSLFKRITRKIPVLRYSRKVVCKLEIDINWNPRPVSFLSPVMHRDKFTMVKLKNQTKEEEQGACLLMMLLLCFVCRQRSCGSWKWGRCWSTNLCWRRCCHSCRADLNLEFLSSRYSLRPRPAHPPDRIENA